MNHTSEPDLSPLDGITRVEAPAFLLTRIHQKIHEANRARTSLSIQWVAGVVFVFFLALNTLAILKITQKNQSTPALAQGMNLVPTSLYNE